jgi:hypothetical protein
MLDYEDIDLANADEVDAQIAERGAIIDRLYGEIAALRHALRHA